MSASEVAGSSRFQTCSSQQGTRARKRRRFKPATRKQTFAECRMCFGVTLIPKQLCDPVPSNLTSFFVSVSCAHTRAATDMNCTLHGVEVRRLWNGCPQPSVGAKVIRCVTCFTILLNLHDFPSEHVITAASVLTMPDTGRLPRIHWKCCLCCTWTPVVNLRLSTCHGPCEVPRGAGESVVSVLISG